MTVPTLIPRKAIFGNPTRLQPAISPDGNLLAFIAPKDDVLNIWVAPIDNPKNAKCITGDTKRGIRQFNWTYSNQIVYIQDKNGDEGMTPALDLQKLLLLQIDVHLTSCLHKSFDHSFYFIDWQTYLVNIETAQERNLTPFKGTNTSPIKLSVARPNEMIIAMNKRDPTVFDLYLVDLTTAELELIEENTGKFGEWHCAE